MTGCFLKKILGAAWGPQHEQITASIFHSLYVVSFSSSGRLLRIDYIPSHILQSSPEVFEPRAPLRETAHRAGWQGFIYNLSKIPAVGINQVWPE